MQKTRRKSFDFKNLLSYTSGFCGIIGDSNTTAHGVALHSSTASFGFHFLEESILSRSETYYEMQFLLENNAGFIFYGLHHGFML